MVKKLKALINNPYSFSMITKIISVLIGFLFTVFQARFLGAEIKGQVAAVNSIVAITSILCDLGISQAYPYYKRNSKMDVLPIFLKIATLLLAIGLVIATVLIAVFDLPLKYIAVVLFTPVMVYDGIISYIVLIEDPNRRHRIDLFVMFVELIFVIVLWLFAPPSFLLGVVIISIKNFTKAMLLTFSLRKKYFQKTESIFRWIPKLVKFGFFPMLCLLMSTLNYRIGVIMMDGKVADAAIGIYSVGVTLAERIWMIPDAIQGVMASRVAKGKNEKEVAFAIRVCNTGCLILILGILVLGRPFIDLVFGVEYGGAFGITLLLLLGVFSMIYYKIIVSFNTVMGKQRVSFTFLLVSAFTNFICCYFLIPRFGIYGSGGAAVISYSLCGMMFVIYFCRTTKMSWKNMLFIRPEDLTTVKQFFVRK